MRIPTLLVAIIVFATISFSCKSQKNSGKSTKSWVMLFDGTNLDKWKGYKKEEAPSGWKIVDKELVLAEKGSGDIITKDQYQNFELELDWKITEGGNSGIFFNIVEDPEFKSTYETAPEMQILDDVKHPDSNMGTNGNRKAGSLYDMIPSAVKAKPAGEWNTARILVNEGQAEFWLNGKKSAEFQMWGDDWNKMVSESKFKDWKGFAKAKKGHIGLQDHGDEVRFRSIRIREL